MDFIDSLKQLALRAEKLKDQILTEEATKMSLIIPFFQALGYDVFNPHEFTPEFTADVGIKKGEKVDYAIMMEGNPTILIEAKSCATTLEKHDSQLFRYFGTTKSKFAILTNGLQFKFYTDLEKPNKMDFSPFLEFDILNIKDNLIPELKKFHKDVFDVKSISSAASELKYSKLINDYFYKQLEDPADDFVRLLVSHVFDGMKTQTVIDKFKPLIKKTLNDYINGLMNDRIFSALKDSQKESSESIAVVVPPEKEIENDKLIVTTAEELEAFYIIKSLLHEAVPSEKVTYKDTGAYFGILYDNNTRKWICRLELSETRKRLYIPDENKNTTRYELESIESLYAFKGQLLESARRYAKPEGK